MAGSKYELPDEFLEAADQAIGEPFGEQIQRRARLFVAGPEQR